LIHYFLVDKNVLVYYQIVFMGIMHVLLIQFSSDFKYSLNIRLWNAVQIRNFIVVSFGRKLTNISSLYILKCCIFYSENQRTAGRCNLFSNVPSSYQKWHRLLCSWNPLKCCLWLVKQQKNIPKYNYFNCLWFSYLYCRTLSISWLFLLYKHDTS